MKPGIYDKLSNAEYHGGAGISKSGLDLVNKSPAHLRFLRDASNDNARQPTEAQALGTAFHELVLEPAEFVKHYTVDISRDDYPDHVSDKTILVKQIEALNELRLPKLSQQGTKSELIERILLDCKLWQGRNYSDLEPLKQSELKQIIDEENITRPVPLKTTGTIQELADVLQSQCQTVKLWANVKAEFEQQCIGRTMLSVDQMHQLERMRDAVFAHPAANALLTGAPGKAEASAYWVDPTTGVLCRCRPDFWRADGIIVDLKSARDASPEGFAKSIVNWRYHVQHAMYAAGVELAAQQSGQSIAPIKAFVFIAVEKDACVVDGVAKGVGVYMLDAASIEIGKMEFRKDLDTYAECENSGVWPGYPTTIQPVTLPAWYAARKEVI